MVKIYFSNIKNQENQIAMAIVTEEVEETF